MSWANNIPSELSVQPLPLVVLTGLDVKHNAIHKEIWDGFYLRSQIKFRYAHLDGDHEYPKAKGKRSTEVYVAKGILKTNWFNKHLYQIPSLVVVFFDLDWDEPNWKEKQMECATKVELVRHTLQDRNTRIILILIQKHPSIPVDGDNGLARERYPSLCTACSIKTNYLFLLHAEYLQGYILKLEEDAFTEPTQTYYNLEIKSVKLKRDSLIKVTHQLLFVRLSIKVAFFFEMKQDVYKAIDNYKQAYLSLLDIRLSDTNVLEIKTVAGVINYKLCKLLFEIKHPIDAIEQFRRHIDIFKIKTGPSDLAFEHSAWLSKQFQVMGELFETAIKKEYFNAVQTQHPGFYFHSSANHAIQRRLIAKEIFQKKKLSERDTESNSIFESLNNLEFFGQRPWRQGQQAIEILDQVKENNGILCLQELESKENLTPLITGLFTHAISHFKVFNCNRMKQYLSVCMAEEYFNAKNYQESLNIYVQVLNDYINEHWWPILTSIIFNALKCAYLIADIANYCLLSTEIIGKNIILSDEIKSSLQKNLLKVISNEVPLAEYHDIDTSVHSIDEAIKKWTEELNKRSDTSLSSPSMETSQLLALHKLVPAHVSGMVPFVDCKTQFTSTIFNSNENIELKVYLRTNCVDLIQFNKLYVKFNISNYNKNCIIDDKKSLLFEPNRIYELKFNFLPNKTDIGRDLEITSISLELGNIDSRVLVLNWKGDCKNALSDEKLTIDTFSKISHGYHKKDQSLIWNEIEHLSTTSIISRKSKIELNLDHKQPIIVNECYPVKLTIVNKEETAIENLSLSVEIMSINSASDIDTPISTIDNKIARLWIENIDKNLNEMEKTKSLPNLESKKQLSEIIYIQIKELKAFNLSIKVKYDLDVIVRMVNYTNEAEFESVKNEFELETKTKKILKCSCVQESKIKLESVNPFNFNFKFLSMQMNPINVIHYGEPFLVLCEITNTTAYSLKFKNSSLVNGPLVKKCESDETETETSFLKDETLKTDEMATDCFSLIVEDNSACDTGRNKVRLGELLLEWKRKNLGSIFDDGETKEDTDDETESNTHRDLFVETRVALPEIEAETFPFIVETQLPTYGWLGKEVNLIYNIKNKTQYVLDIECVLDENEFFALSGKKVEFMQIMPNDSNKFSFVLYPLRVGHCKLPYFHVKVNSPVQFSEAAKLQENKSDETSNFDSIIENMIPSKLFIFPEKMETLLQDKVC